MKPVISKFQVIEHHKEQGLLNLKTHIIIYDDAYEQLINDFNKSKGKDLEALFKCDYFKEKIIKFDIIDGVHLYTIGSYKIVPYPHEIQSIIKNSHEVKKHHQSSKATYKYIIEKLNYYWTNLKNEWEIYSAIWLECQKK